MKSETALKNVERRAWLRVFEDGLWDMMVGFVFASFGLAGLLPDIGGGSFAAVAVAVGIPVFAAGKRYIAEPRVGRVHFGPRRKRQASRVCVLLAALALLGLAFAVLRGLPAESAPALEWIRRHSDIVLGLVWGGSLAAAGWMVGLRRFSAYGLILLAALVGSDLAPGRNSGAALTASGGLIMLCGIVLAVRSIHRYPRRSASGGQDAQG